MSQGNFGGIPAQSLVSDTPTTPPAQQQAPGFGEVVGAAVDTTWIGPAIMRSVNLMGFDPDPYFILNENSLKEKYGKDIPSEFWPKFGDATSDAQAMFIRRQLLDRLDSAKVLSAAGWEGTAASLVVGLVDPVFLGVTAFTEGAAAPFIYGGRATRIGMMAKQGLVTGGELAAIEGYRVSQPTEIGSASDVLFAGGMGLALGGLGGLLHGTSPEIANAGRKITKNIQHAEAKASGATITDAGKAHFKDQIAHDKTVVDAVKTMQNPTKTTPEEAWSALRAGAEPNPQGLQLDSEIVKTLVDPPAGLENKAAEALAPLPEAVDRLPKHAMGATSAKPERDIYRLDLSKATDEPSVQVMNIPRADMVGRIKQSPVPEVRLAGSMIAEDIFPDVSGNPTAPSASEWVNLTMKRRATEWARSMQDNFGAWSGSQNVKWWDRRARGRFNELVAQQVRLGNVEDIHVQRQAIKFAELMSDSLKMAKEYGVPGFDEIPFDTRYFPRMASINKIYQAIDRFGRGAVDSFVGRAVFAGSDNLTEEQAMKLGRAWIDHNLSDFWNTDFNKARVFSTDQRETLADILKRHGKLDDSEIDTIVNQTIPGEGGKLSVTKRRMDLDEGFSTNLADAKTGQSVPFTVSDLLENDAEAVMAKYTRSITGHAADQEFLRAMTKRLKPDAKPDAVPMTYDGMVHRLEQIAKDTVGTKHAAKFKRDMSRLDTLHHAVLGIPIEEPSGWKELSRTLRAFNFVRVMGRAGFAQIAEIGNATGEMGIKAMMQQMPAFNDLIAIARDGKVSNQLLSELESAIAIGTEGVRHKTSAMFEDAFLYRTVPTGVESALQGAQRAVGKLSLLQPIDSTLRKWAGAAAVQRVLNDAFSDRVPKPSRLASIGLKTDEWKAIAKQVRHYATTEEGMLGRKVKRINLEQWADKDAAAKFIIGLDKWTRRVVQENDIGNMSQWMTTELGKVLIQFRAFPIVAWNKQLMYGIHNFDQAVFNSWSLSMLAGGLAYVSMTYADSIGRDNREEFLAQRINPKEIGKAAFQRAGFSSILPGAVDTITSWGGIGPTFSYARTTGLSQNFLTGNPAVDLISRIIDAPKSVVAPLINPDYRFSQQDMRSLTAILPFQNVMGIANMLHAMRSQLPKTSQENP